MRHAEQADAKAIVDIYNHYVLNSTATFEEEAVSVDDMRSRMVDVKNANLPWLVVEENDHIVGYAYATKWKPRSAYRFSVESSVYIAPSAYGKGYGGQLYALLFDELKQRGVHSVMGGISLPNPASIALHEKLDMTKIAHLHQVGFKFGEWVDIGYWQRILSD